MYIKACIILKPISSEPYHPLSCLFYFRLEMPEKLKNKCKRLDEGKMTKA